MASDNQPLPWVGINHLALITDDMDATVRFWHGVLQAELVATIARPTFRHYFFKLGPTTTVAFFEYTDEQQTVLSTDPVVKPAGEHHHRAGHFDHLSLDLPDDAALFALQARLREAGCEVTELVDHHIVHSVYFTDPNGIALEASCWVGLPVGTVPALDDPEFFDDADPVPAVRELLAGGLLHTPATHLVDSVT
ncbi:MAG TPA: VOC family protein [Ilumatobacter sp.]|nr:VOC family protein [Ilumatobacter sp.]